MKTRTSTDPARILSLIEIALLLGLVALTWCWRWQQAGIANVDPDEIFLLGGVDRMARGMLPYVDHAEAHMPLVSRMLVPVWRVASERPDVLAPFRTLEWFAVSLAQLAMGVVAWRFGRLRAAAWALGVASAFGFYLERLIHVRFEPFATILALAAFAIFASRRKAGFGAREGIAAVVMGLATASHVSGPFLVAAFLIALFVLDSGARGVRSAILFGAMALGAWTGVFALILGKDLLTGFAALRSCFAFDTIYQAALRSDLTVYLPAILRESPVAATLLVLAMIAAHDAVLRRRYREPALVLALLMADFSIGIVLTRSPDYPQRYLPLATFGSIVAGLEIARRVDELRDGVALRVVPIAAVLGALALTWQTFGFLFAAPPIPPAYVKKPNEIPVPRLSAGYRILPDDALMWWDTGGAAPDAFRSRTLAEYRAVTRFLRTHSSPDDRVFSDWMNPPLRELPALHHHGAMIDIFERSPDLAKSPTAQAAYRRYNPDYRSSPRAEESFATMFDRANTRIIALDGSMGRAFRADAEFRRWMTEHYDLVLEPRSEIVFAVRR